MLHLNSISLLQFKNYLQSDFQFRQRIVGISGKNGIGKTNLLDAIYYCCFTKSYFTKSDAQNVSDGKQGFRLEGNFHLNNTPQAVTCVLRETGKKELALNQELYVKFSDHIGKFPCIMIAPDDVQIITGGSEERRQFLDTLLSQIDHDYLLQLIHYNKVLLQRNALLKSFAESRRVDENLLQVLNEQLARPGAVLFEKRRVFLQEFIVLVRKFYQQISGENYPVHLEYISQLHSSSFKELFDSFHEKDLALQRTGGGVHRDDIAISLGNASFKAIASQGQRKSMLFALKLSAFEVLKNRNGFSPILLLDDIFEKLDETRMDNLLNWVCRENNGQIFITDTHPERIHQHLGNFNSVQFIVLS
ncbi:MAG: DNA replication and repair protein RecF [Chitinophagaceae bacterium]|nr:DNA replication and repair protein RecF [Chitinophagaceae bacterium]